MADKNKKDDKKAYKPLIQPTIWGYNWVRILSAIFVPILIWQMCKGTRPRNYIEKEWASFTAPLHKIEAPKFSSPAPAPVCPGRAAEAPCQPVQHQQVAQQVIRVEVDPEKWTDWVHLPPNSHFEIVRPGCWEEYQFWDGRTIKFGENDRGWIPGDIPHNTFKLRGTKGTVEILIEPK